MLPIIFQHVRELVELQLAGTESSRYKIITPFPPASSDFADFDDAALAFGDPPKSGDSASQDTVRAFEFFNRADYLYYDYSYGIRSDEYRLSSVCRKFFGNALPAEGDLDFDKSFHEKKDAFEQRYLRSTVGDLGNYHFRYTSPSMVSWYPDRAVLQSPEVERMKEKAIAVYEDLDAANSGLVAALVESIRSTNYASVSYDLGFFDVIREWMNPRLFEHPGWTFPSGGRQLYGEGDPAFTGDDVSLKLCFAQRFYLLRNCTAELKAPTPPPGGVVVRDHRSDDDPTHEPGGVTVRDHRRDVDTRRRIRNEFVAQKIARYDAATTAAMLAMATAPMELPLAVPTAVFTPAPATRSGFVWVPATATVPGHWERERAQPDPESTPPPAPPVYRIAAVKCRLVAPRPEPVVPTRSEERPGVPT